MDEIIQQVAADHRKAACIHLAFLVEQTANSLGLIHHYVDENGDGPFIREIYR